MFLVIGLLVGIIAIKAAPMLMGFAVVTTQATTGNLGPSVDSINHFGIDGEDGTITLMAGNKQMV